MPKREQHRRTFARMMQAVLAGTMLCACSFDFESYSFADAALSDARAGEPDSGRDASEDAMLNDASASDGSTAGDASMARDDGGGSLADAAFDLGDASRALDASTDASTTDASAPSDATTPSMDAALDAPLPIECPSTPGKVEVTPLYGAATWNHYVANDKDDIWQATGNPCSLLSVNRLDACVHAGELRQAVWTTTRTCDGVQIEDSLQAFDWECDDSHAGELRFRTRGLRPAMGLSDLVDFTVPAFRTLSVKVTDAVCGELAYSEPRVWWSDVFRTVDLSSVTPFELDDSDAVYVVTAGAPQETLLVPDISIQAEFVSIVIDPMVRAAPKLPNGTMLATQVRLSSLWLEGKFDCTGLTGYCVNLFADLSQVRHLDLAHTATSADNGLLLNLNGTGNVLHGFRGTSLGSIGMDFDGDWNRAEDVVMDMSGQSAIRASGVGPELSNLTLRGGGLVLDGTRHHVHGARVENAGEIGIGLYGAGGHLLHDSRVARGYIGIQLSSPNNTVIDTVVSNTSASAVQLGRYSYGSTNNRVINTQATGTGSWAAFEVNIDSHSLLLQDTAAAASYGVQLGYTSASGTALQHFVAYDNQVGLRVCQNASDVTVHDGLAAGSDDFSDVMLDGTARFTGALLMSATGACTIAADGVGLDKNGLSECIAGKDSTVTVTGSNASPSPLTGMLVGADPVNKSELSGNAPYDMSLITDWHTFAQPARVWGRYSDAMFPSSTFYGSCDDTHACAVFDWSLAGGAGKGFVSDVWAASNVRSHVWEASDAGACAQIAGAAWDGACASNYLQSATELIDDGVGNDNGLCESDEACLEHRDLGAMLVAPGTPLKPLGTHDAGPLTAISVFGVGP